MLIFRYHFHIFIYSCNIISEGDFRIVFIKISPFSTANHNVTPPANARLNSQFHKSDLQPQFTDSISFSGLLPQNAKIKLAVFDIDETLKHWNENLSEELCQKLRDELFKHTKDQNIQTVYSSDRGFEKILPLIEDGTLAMPDWIVGNNGGAIFKNVNGKFEEIKSWSEDLINKFKKNETRNILAKIANEPQNMFTAEEWAKIPVDKIPEGQKEFRGSKITEYVGHESPINMRLVFAPGTYKKNLQRMKKELKENGIQAKTIFFHYPTSWGSYESLTKYFGTEKANIIRMHYEPRLYPDGSYDNLLLTASDKGMATEFIRKALKLKKKEVFAVGDGENDYANANKGYYFTLMSNAVEGLKKMIGINPKENIILASKPGVEGILEVLV